jgi:tetratricopeptide (TPR) repeat protein
MRIFTFLLLILSFASISAQTLIEDAEKSLMLREYPECVEICKSILKSSPDRDDARLIMGMAYQAMQDYQSALDNYHLSANKTDVTLQYLEAECLEGLGNIDSSVNIYSSIRENDTGNLHALRNLARIKLKTKNYSEAKDYYKELVEEYPDNYLFNKSLGICNYQLHEEFFALDNFLKAWDLNKNDLELPINIANVYARMQKPVQALDILAEGLLFDSTNVAIIKTSAFISYKLGDNDSAAYQFEKVLALGDSTKFTRKYMGISYYNTFELDSAITNLRAAYSLDTLDTETTYYLGLALTTMHGKLEGIEFLKETIELMTPDSAFCGSVYASIARAWSDINERAYSIRYYSKAIANDPYQPIYIYNKARIHDQLGIMHQDRKQLNTAIGEYERFIEIQLAMLESVMVSRGLDEDQISTPDINFSRLRIKKIKNELFFMGTEEK